MTRDWSRERWRKQYVREPLQQRLWSVMTRGLRELLNALAEEDGALVREEGDPVEALVRALAPHDAERELVRAAIRTLLRDGFLVVDGSSLFVEDFASAQASHQREVAPPARNVVAPAPGEAPKTSTERVRQFRERERARRGAVSASETDAPGSWVVSSSVSETGSPISETVSPSRGDLKADPLQILNSEKDKEKDLPLHRRAGVSRNAQRVSSQPFRGNGGNEEDDEAIVPRNLEQALAMPVAARAALVERRPELAGALSPERWPEVLAVASAFAEATGLHQPGLGRYVGDEGVRAVVKLFAAGFAQTGLEYVARVVPKQPWWTAGGKRLGLSSLSLEVVRRNLPAADGRPRIASPSVAKVVAELAVMGRAHG